MTIEETVNQHPYDEQVTPEGLVVTTKAVTTNGLRVGEETTTPPPSTPIHASASISKNHTRSSSTSKRWWEPDDRDGTSTPRWWEELEKEEDDGMTGGTSSYMTENVYSSAVGPPKPNTTKTNKKKEYIVLPREELEAMMDTRVQQERDKMEAMVEERISQALFGKRDKAANTNDDKQELLRVQEEEENPLNQEKFDPDCMYHNELDGGDDDDEWHSPFGESVYTLLYVYNFNSQSFIYAVFVYGVQMSAIVLTLVDIAPNPTPPMVDSAVTYAQALTMFLLLANMSDLIDSALKLQAGFYPEVLSTHPGATYSTWLFSCLAQLVAGLLLLVTSFILTMQSATVIDLMLNLTALVFMAEIDDLGFSMAAMGFITDNLQKEAEAVVDFQVPKRKKINNMLRRVLYLLTLIGLYTLYGVKKNLQLSGHFLPTNLYVQFGDAYNPKIPFFSGVLTSGNVFATTHRRYHDVETGNISLSYCSTEQSWTFSDVNDPCDYFAKSYKTQSYDVTTLHDSEWEVTDSLGRLQPFDSFSLVNRDCDSSKTKTCQGTCEGDGFCKCPHDQFGMDCEFVNACPDLFVDQRFEPFPPLGIIDPTNGLKVFGISDEFHLLQNPTTGNYVRVYDMPVYYSNKTYPANIIFFGGRRWVITTEWDLLDLAQAEKENPNTYFFLGQTVSILENDFHGYHHATYTPFYISDPVDFETPWFKPTPVGLQWWKVQNSDTITREYIPDVPINTFLECRPPPESCLGQPNDFCNNGVCDTETALCTCLFGFSGDQCDLALPCYDWVVPCSGNGICDLSSGTCGCNFPHYGLNCERAHKCFEEAGKCQNGGVCNEVTGHCDCPEDPAVSGVACEKRNDCAILGCENGGLCGPAGICICRSPFYGANCALVNTTIMEEQSFCATDDDCGGMNGGTCNMDYGMCTCGDPRRYGPLCQYIYNCSNVVPETWHLRHVTAKPCQNSGICNAETGVCDCPTPFFGPDCSQVPPCFNDQDCGGGVDSGGGLCIESAGLCRCPYGLIQGKQCEKTLICTRDEDCQNGGSCDTLRGRCQCHTTGVGGAACDSMVAGMYDPTFDDLQVRAEEDVERCGFQNPTCD